MMLEVLTSLTPNLASEILQRTASAPRVQQIVQLSLAPAFLLGGIGAIMNVLMSRLVWIAERIERIEHWQESDERGAPNALELAWLDRRKAHAQRAVMLSAASAAAISVVIALLFVSAYIKPQIGTLIAIAWIVTMALLIAALGFFLIETRLAAIGADRVRRSLLKRRD
jgi:hypothetical protein